MTLIQLVKPNPSHIASYVQALKSGWHDMPTGTAPESVLNKIRELEEDPSEHLSLFDDPNARAQPYLLPDKTVAYAVPSLRRWIWNQATHEYCGTLSLRWQKNTTELPPHLMGHIGYCVAPGFQNKGYASFALGEMLKLAHQQGLPFVYIVTNTDNLASIRVIERNAGELVETFTKPAMYGTTLAHRYKLKTGP